MNVLKVSLMAGLIYCITAQAAEVRVYNWDGYIGKETVAHFEKETGIKVKYDVFDSYETVEAKLLSGNSGYDVVNMSSYYLSRQGPAGVWTTLDKNKLPNWKNLDPDIVKRVGSFDPNNQFGEPWSWYSAGIAYNKAEVAKRLNTTPDSWGMIFEVENMQKMASCGVTWTDAYSDLFVPALIYWGFDPFSENAQDYDVVLEKASKIRPFVRNFSNTYWNDMAEGNTCVSVSWSGDVASYGLDNVKKGVELTFFLPKEGSYIDYDVMGIPSDAPNKEEAYAFLNFIMRPEEAADFTNTVKYPNSITASKKLLPPKLLDGSIVFYPTEAQLKVLHPFKLESKKIERYQTRLWTKFKTGV